MKKPTKLLLKQIEANPDAQDWENILSKYKLSEEFIEKYINSIKCIDYVVVYQEISNSFIQKHQNRIYWKTISAFYKLSEEFIEKYSEKVDWCWISCYQKLSPEFIEKHKNKIDKEAICNKYQIVKKLFLDENKKILRKLLK